jgi:hypothetical protein
MNEKFTSVLARYPKEEQLSKNVMLFMALSSLDDNPHKKDIPIAYLHCIGYKYNEATKIIDEWQKQKERIINKNGKFSVNDILEGETNQ